MSRTYLWDAVERDSMGHMSYGSSGSCMYSEDDSVFYEYYDFDHEDNRMYEYSCRFRLSDYKDAIRDLKEKKFIALEGEDGSQMTILYGPELVTLRINSTPSPCSTPGGALLCGVQTIHQRLEDLILN